MSSVCVLCWLFVFVFVVFFNVSVVSGMGQLLVWEWQSESYVFKQQGHFNNMASLAYSPDGQYIATGGDDGKVSVKYFTLHAIDTKPVFQNPQKQ